MPIRIFSLLRTIAVIPVALVLVGQPIDAMADDTVSADAWQVKIVPATTTDQALSESLGIEIAALEASDNGGVRSTDSDTASATDVSVSTDQSEKKSKSDKKSEKKIAACGVKDSRSYREIYLSIPFSRGEYNANSAYRHQATMEIMLGQLHPIVVAPAAPAKPRPRAHNAITIRFLPIVRRGYRSYSRYPWH